LGGLETGGRPVNFIGDYDVSQLSRLTIFGGYVMPTKRITINQLQSQLYSVVCQVKVINLAVGSIPLQDGFDEDVQNGFMESLQEVTNVVEEVSREMSTFKDPLTPQEIRALIQQVDEKTNGKSKKVIPLVTA